MRATTWPWAAALAAVAATAVVLWPPPAPQRLSLLVIVWDTVRADRLSLYGHPVPTTPRLTERAATGRVFTQATSPATWTVPAHASLFTGLDPRTHGAYNAWRWLDGHHITLAELLAEQGYDTYGFSANPNLHPQRVNLTQGFQRFETVSDKRWKPKIVRWLQQKNEEARRDDGVPSDAWPRLRAPPVEAGPLTAEALLGWLDQRDDPSRPWFAYLNYMEAHHPRMPTREARALAMPDPRLRERAARLRIDRDQQLDACYGQYHLDDEDREAVEALYDATLIDLDRWTDELLEALEARGELDHTVVVLTSDHGEYLGDHGLLAHRHDIHQALVGVPLVIWAPQGPRDRVDQPVSTSALFGTLLATLGVPAPPTAHRQTDLLAPQVAHPAVLTESLDVDTRGWHDVRSRHPESPALWDRSFQKLRDGRWALLRDSEGARRLFDLASDPHEQSDLAAAHPHRVADLEQQLDAEVAARPPYDPDQRGPDDRPRGAGPKELKLLEALGYLDEDP